MRRPLTKTRIGVIAILALMCLAYAGGAAYFNSTAFRNTLLDEVNTALEGRIAIGGHDLALHDGRLELSDVILTDDRGEPLASINEVQVRWSWLALLRKTVHIKTLTMEKPHLHLGYHQDDHLRQIKPAPPPQPPEKKEQNEKKWGFRIDRLRIEEGNIRFERPSKSLHGTLDGVSITAALDSTKPDGHVHITAGPLDWRQPKSVFTLPSLELSAALDASRHLEAEVKTPTSDVKLKALLKGPPAGKALDLKCDLNLRLEAFHGLLPQLAGVRGLLAAHITAEGDPKDPTVSLLAELSEGNIQGVNFDQLKTDLHLHRRNITVNDLSGHDDWGKARVTGQIGLQSVFSPNLASGPPQWEGLSYALKVEGDQLRPDRLDVIKVPTGGKFKLVGEFNGTGLTASRAHGDVRMDIEVSELSPRAGAPEINGRLSAEAQRNGAAITLKRLKARVGDNDLQARGLVDLSTRRIEQAMAELECPRIEEIGHLFGIPLPSGNGRVKISANGPFQQPTAQLEILAEGLSMAQRPLGRLLAQARLDDQGLLEIPRLVLENRGSLVEGSGRLALFHKKGGVKADPGVGVDLTFKQLAPADFGLVEMGDSRFNGHVNFSGSIQHLTGRAIVEESVVQWGGFDGRLRADGRWVEGQLTIEDLTLFKKQSSVHMNGTVIWPRAGKKSEQATPVIQARLHGQDLRLQDFFPDHQGTVRAMARVEGPVTDLDGVFEVSAEDLTVGGQPFRSLTAKGAVTSEKVRWDPFELVVETGQALTSRGWFAFDRRFNVSAATQGIDLKLLVPLQQAYPTGGRLELDLKADGTLDAPQLDARATIHAPRLKDQPWDDFHLTARIRESRLSLAADLNFDLAANYHLDSGEFDVQGNFDQSDLSPYLALWASPEWTGRLSGRLNARGNRNHPELIQAGLSISDARLTYQDQLILSAPLLKASLGNGRIEVPSARMTLMDDGFVDLSAAGSWPADFRIDAGGRLPLTALTPFMGSLAPARGQLAFQTQVRGPLEKVAWQATLDLKEAGFEVPGLDQQVEKLNGTLEITPAALVVRSLSGHLDGGRFDLDGQMTLTQWRPTGGQMTLKATALPLQWPDTMDVVVNGDLTFKGEAKTTALTGDLILLEGTYYKDVKLNLLSAVTQTKRAVPVPATISFPGQLGETTLNVTVTHRYPLLVDNNLANLQIAPDLRISGTLARPIISGRAQVTEGEVIFRRKAFEVKRGVVDFVNPYKIEPNLDIMAEADIRQWRVSLSLAGPPDQLVFKLDSNPPESESDILSLILLGRTGSELAGGKKGGGQTTRQMLASLVATAWGEDVKKHTGMDILEVETGTGEDQESADRVQVTVGKRLSRRLTVKYEVESGNEELVQRAISEYRFLEHLLASGFQDSRGGYGGELVFRIEF